LVRQCRTVESPALIHFERTENIIAEVGGQIDREELLKGLISISGGRLCAEPIQRDVGPDSNLRVSVEDSRVCQDLNDSGFHSNGTRSATRSKLLRQVNRPRLIGNSRGTGCSSVRDFEVIEFSVHTHLVNSKIIIPK
jgi:hypothetical protein